jgi:hypothetical protein
MHTLKPTYNYSTGHITKKITPKAHSHKPHKGA